LWISYGIPELADLKVKAMNMLAAQTSPLPELPPPLDRAGRATVEVALRQWRQVSSSRRYG